MIENRIFDIYKSTYAESLSTLIKTRTRILEELTKEFPELDSQACADLADKMLRKFVRYIGPEKLLKDFLTDQDFHKTFLSSETDHQYLRESVFLRHFLTANILRNLN